MELADPGLGIEFKSRITRGQIGQLIGRTLRQRAGPVLGRADQAVVAIHQIGTLALQVGQFLLSGAQLLTQLITLGSGGSRRLIGQLILMIELPLEMIGDLV